MTGKASAIGKRTRQASIRAFAMAGNIRHSAYIQQPLSALTSQGQASASAIALKAASRRCTVMQCGVERVYRGARVWSERARDFPLRGADVYALRNETNGNRPRVALEALFFLPSFLFAPVLGSGVSHVRICQSAVFTCFHG